MKKFITSVVAVLMVGFAMNASTFDPKDILGKLAGSGSSGDTEQSGSTSDGDGGGILGAIGNFINNTIASNKFTVDDLVGTWNYVSPAVSFQSDNALKKIGGAGAATALEDKLAPYYTKLGFTRTTLTVEEDHSFTMKLGLLQLQGTVEKSEDDMLVFNFSAFGRVPLGKVTANATKAGSTLNLTFDASRMIEILNKVSGALNLNTIKTLTDLLNSYEGVYMGFKLKK